MPCPSRFSSFEITHASSLQSWSTWTKEGIRDAVDITFATGTPSVFPRSLPFGFVARLTYHLGSHVRRTKSVSPPFFFFFFFDAPLTPADLQYAKALNALREKRGVEGLFNANLISIDNKTRTATFVLPEGKTLERKFDLLHVVPPQGPLDFIKTSPIGPLLRHLAIPGPLTDKSSFGNQQRMPLDG